MAVRFAAVGVAAVLALPVPGAYAGERVPGPTPVSVSVATSPSRPSGPSEPPGSAAFRGDGREREALPGREHRLELPFGFDPGSVRVRA